MDAHTVRRIIVRLLVLGYFACGIVWASAYFNSGKYLIVSILHLPTPICLFYIIVSTAYLMLTRQWKNLIFPLVLVVANIGNYFSFFSLTSNTSFRDSSFEVLSYNVSFFKIPSVFSKAYFDSASAKHGNKMIELIKAKNSSVVCLQEFFTDGESKHHNYLDKLMAAGYDVNVFALQNPKNETLRGLVTCSKFPVVEKGQVFISANRYNGAFYTDLLVKSDTIRVINVHLQSMELYFGKKGAIDKVKHFWRHYKSAMVIRTQQVELLTKFVSESPYPVILAGDFNETPYSFNHKKFREQLTNSFEFAGNGFGSTFRESLMPIRIDHQYFSDKIHCEDFEVIRSAHASDHYPIVARYQRME
jgi:endonuclease/exonuclease/phosphatase family metal-dependent hydrolase